MSTGRSRFNLNLILTLALAAAVGCATKPQKKTEKPQKMMASLRVHVQADPEPIKDFTVEAPVYRAAPSKVTVEKEAFLTEANLSEAKVVDELGGFKIQLQFDRQGTWILEEYTTTHQGRRFVFFSAWEGRDTKKDSRWLGAPVITKRISNGLVSFTPDASREELEDIVLGLNNAAKKHEEDSKW